MTDNVVHLQMYVKRTVIVRHFGFLASLYGKPLDCFRFAQLDLIPGLKPSRVEFNSCQARVNLARR